MSAMPCRVRIRCGAQAALSVRRRQTRLRQMSASLLFARYESVYEKGDDSKYPVYAAPSRPREREAFAGMKKK